ncbi:MAG TPA: alpha/beta hydrolase [Caulobacteraceae bacterium]|nr:alpha/beta hydrolase [Caulobacteraceae bacterium]
MDAAVFHEPTRRFIAIESRAGAGEMAALDFGPQDRPYDIVFLHANGFNALTYRSILGPLSAGLRILAVDQRGHGESRLAARPEGRRSWKDFRDDLVALLDVLDQPPVVLSGHSMGGTVSLLAAAMRPKKVSSLVLVEPVMMPPLVALYAQAPWTSGRLWKRMRIAQRALRRKAVFDSRELAFNAYKGRGAFKTWPDKVVADYVAGGFHDRPDGKVELACAPQWEASSYVAQGHNPWATLRKLRVPVRILKAEKGSTCRGSLRDFHRRKPDLRLETIAGSTHFLPMERPDLIRDALLDAAV